MNSVIYFFISIRIPIRYPCNIRYDVKIFDMTSKLYRLYLPVGAPTAEAMADRRGVGRPRARSGGGGDGGSQL